MDVVDASRSLQRIGVPRGLVARRAGGQVISDDGDPVALADRVGGAAGQDAEGCDLDPTGDGLTGTAGHLDGQTELGAWGAFAAGEGAGGVAHRSAAWSAASGLPKAVRTRLRRPDRYSEMLTQ